MSFTTWSSSDSLTTPPPRRIDGQHSTRRRLSARRSTLGAPRSRHRAEAHRVCQICVRSRRQTPTSRDQALAFRPLETALGGRGRCDLHPEQGLPAPAGGHRPVQDDRGPVPLPGLDAPGGQHPGGHHLHRRDGRGAPRARRRLHEGHDQGRPVGERAQARRRGDPQPADVLPRRRGHLPGHQGRRHGAEPVSARNLPCVEIGKDFMVSHGYIKNDFDVHEWAAPEFLEQAATEVLNRGGEDTQLEQAPRGRRRDPSRARASRCPSRGGPALPRP